MLGTQFTIYDGGEVGNTVHRHRQPQSPSKSLNLYLQKIDHITINQLEKLEAEKAA